MNLGDPKSLAFFPLKPIEIDIPLKCGKKEPLVIVMGDSDGR